MTLPTDIVFEDIRAERDRYTDLNYNIPDDRDGVDNLVSFALRHIGRSNPISIIAADRRAELVKAAAMLAAAIELMDRAESSDGE